MADLTPLLAFRWSPRAFHPTAALTGDEAASLLEAARWAPSAGNVPAVAVRPRPPRRRDVEAHPGQPRRGRPGLGRHAAALVVGAHTGGDPDGTRTTWASRSPT